jgi:hypothetical protein
MRFMRLPLALLFCALAVPAFAANELSDLGCETTTTAGQGTLDLDGAASGGYLGLIASGLSSGATIPYRITNGTGASRKVENGFGVVTDGSPDTLTRASSIVSSDGVGTKLTLSGTSTVCVAVTEALLTTSGWNIGGSPVIALGTDTTGNYAAGDAEAGAALTGDSATAFFSTGTFEDALVAGSAEVDEVLNSDLGDFTCSAGTCAIDAGAVVTAGILDGTITEADLKVVDSPADEECFTYESTTGDFEWQSCGGSQTPWASNIDAAGFDLTDVGDLVVGNATSLTMENSRVPALQVVGTDGNTSAFALGRHEAGNTPPRFFFYKSRNTTPGSFSATADDDQLGEMKFLGDDGTDLVAVAASIVATVDGTVSNNVVPGSLQLRVADSAGTNTTRLNIQSSGVVMAGSNETPVVGDIGNDSAITPLFQVAGLTGAEGAISVSRFSASGEPRFMFQRSHGATYNSFTIVSDNDNLGELSWSGSDGTGSDFAMGAKINAEVQGTPGNGDMPISMVFSVTADGSNDTTARWRINQNGVLSGPTATEVTSAQFDNTHTPTVQLHGTSGNSTTYATAAYSTTAATGPLVVLGRSRGASIGTLTVTNDDDALGRLSWQGTDGTNFEEAARIEAFVDNTPGNDDMPGRLVFSTTANNAHAPTAHFAIDEVGKAIFSNSGTVTPLGATVGGNKTPGFQINGTDGNSSLLLVTSFSAGGGTPRLYFGNSRNASVGSYTIVQDGDEIGEIDFIGSDGTDFANAGASITAAVEGTPASNSMPGNIRFRTSDGSTLSPRMYIRASGGVVLSTTLDSDPGAGNFGIDDSGEFRLYETEANGDSYFSLIAPDALSGNVTCTIDASGKIPTSCIANRTENITVAASDEITAIAAAAGKVKFRMPYAFTVDSVRCSLSTAQNTTGGGTIFTVDINEGDADLDGGNPVSILSTKVTIDDDETTSEDAAAAPVISDSALADNAEMTIDVDAIGTSADAAGLKCSLVGHQ